METAFHDLDPSRRRHFFKQLCRISLRVKKREHSAAKLNMHLKKIKKHSAKKNFHKDIAELHDKIKDYVTNERKMRVPMPIESSHDGELRAQIALLEAELAKAREEKRHAEEDKKEQIRDIVNAVSMLKLEIETLQKEQDARMKRRKELKEKINRTVKR